MAIPLLALLTQAPALFSAGIDLFNTITGREDKTIQTPEQLVQSVESLPPEQRTQWHSEMAEKIKMYEAQTSRLQNEQGDVTPEMMAMLDHETRKDLAEYRMMTRPWAVRHALRFIIIPPYIVITNDFFVIWAEAIARLKGKSKLDLPIMSKTLFAPDSQFFTVYAELISACLWIVLSYMMLREIGKASNGEGAFGAMTNLLGKLPGLFGRGKK